MKKTLKITLACITAITVLTGCGLSFSTSAEARSLTPEADSASVLTETSVRPAAAELSTEIDTDVSKRDASGEYDASEAVVLEPGDDLTITEAGTYILSGTYTDQMVVVDAGSEDKIQIVLDNAEITNSEGPAIYIRSADKVFITAAEGTENRISDGTDYTLTDGETELDAAVFSRDDLTLNGAGTLTINGNYKHGVVSKDDLVITVCSLTVEAENTGLHGKDCVKISGAEVTVTAGTDGIRSDNGTDAERGFIALNDSTVTVTAEKDGFQAETYFLSEDSNVTITSGTYTGTQSAKGWGGGWGSTSYSSSSSESYKGVKGGVEIVINGGTWTVESEDDALHTNGSLTITSGSFTLRSGDDAIHADEKVTITGGTLDITAYEGIEGTYILISGGEITIEASDDGINAARKSSSYTPTVEITGGNLTITMGAGDTDGIDSNGNILISGGTVSVTGNSTFDYEGTGTITGGSVYVNGQQVTELPNQFMGGGFGGGPGGSQGGGWGGPGEDQQGGYGGGFGGGHRG